MSPPDGEVFFTCFTESTETWWRMTMKMREKRYIDNDNWRFYLERDGRRTELRPDMPLSQLNYTRTDEPSKPLPLVISKTYRQVTQEPVIRAWPEPCCQVVKVLVPPSGPYRYLYFNVRRDEPTSEKIIQAAQHRLGVTGDYTLFYERREFGLNDTLASIKYPQCLPTEDDSSPQLTMVRKASKSD